jgi:hypothetical protein
MILKSFALCRVGRTIKEMRVRTGLAMLPVLLLGCGDGNPAAGQEAGAAEAGAPDIDMGLTETPSSTGSCEDDSLGNTAQARSHQLTGSADLPDLKLCPGSDDWFRLDATEAGSLGVTACRDSNDKVDLDFAVFRQEFGELYRHTNCASSGGAKYCTGTCLIEAPGIYYFRVNAPSPLRYALGATVKPPENPVVQMPPSFDAAVVLQPDMARELTVCAPQAKWILLQIAEPSMATIESTMTYSGYYLDFTLTAENGSHVAYWPQGAGKTRHQQALDPGRYLLRMRSALSGCRMFTLNFTRVAR